MRPCRAVRYASHVLLLAAIVIPSATLSAQEAPPVAPGERVRLQVWEAPLGAPGPRDVFLREGSHTGKVASLTRDSLYFLPDRGDSVGAVAWRSLESIDLSTGTVPLGVAIGRGVAAGAGLGLLAAAIQFAASGGDCRDFTDPRCFMTVRGFAIVMGSAAAGGLIGATMAGERWKRIFPAEIAVGLPASGQTGVALGVSVRLK